MDPMVNLDHSYSKSTVKEGSSPSFQSTGNASSNASSPRPSSTERLSLSALSEDVTKQIDSVARQANMNESSGSSEFVSSEVFLDSVSSSHLVVPRVASVSATTSISALLSGVAKALGAHTKESSLNDDDSAGQMKIPQVQYMTLNLHSPIIKNAQIGQAIDVISCDPEPEKTSCPTSWATILKLLKSSSMYLSPIHDRVDISSLGNFIAKQIEKVLSSCLMSFYTSCFPTPKTKNDLTNILLLSSKGARMLQSIFADPCISWNPTKLSLIHKHILRSFCSTCEDGGDAEETVSFSISPIATHIYVLLLSELSGSKLFQSLSDLEVLKPTLINIYGCLCALRSDMDSKIEPRKSLLQRFPDLPGFTCSHSSDTSRICLVFIPQGPNFNGEIREVGLQFVTARLPHYCSGIETIVVDGTPEEGKSSEKTNTSYWIDTVTRRTMTAVLQNLEKSGISTSGGFIPISKRRVFLIGFNAGGMLAARTAVRMNQLIPGGAVAGVCMLNSHCKGRGGPDDPLLDLECPVLAFTPSFKWNKSTHHFLNCLTRHQESRLNGSASVYLPSSNIATANETFMKQFQRILAEKANRESLNNCPSYTVPSSMKIQLPIPGPCRVVQVDGLSKNFELSLNKCLSDNISNVQLYSAIAYHILAFCHDTLIFNKTTTVQTVTALRPPTVDISKGYSSEPLSVPASPRKKKSNVAFSNSPKKYAKKSQQTLVSAPGTSTTPSGPSHRTVTPTMLSGLISPINPLKVELFP